MLYVKNSNSASCVSVKYPIQLVSFKLGNRANVELELPLPAGMYFWNTMVLGFTVILEGNARDGINSHLVKTIHSQNYTIIDSRICGQDAYVLVCKWR